MVGNAEWPIGVSRGSISRARGRWRSKQKTLHEIECVVVDDQLSFVVIIFGAGDAEAVRARSVPAPEMVTETKEIKPPPDRDAVRRTI